MVYAFGFFKLDLFDKIIYINCFGLAFLLGVEWVKLAFLYQFGVYVWNSL